MDLGLMDRVALVTASSDGLGYATAEALVAEGARVVVCGRRKETLAGAVDRLGTGQPQRVIGVPADVTEPDAPARLVEEAATQWGRLDIVVANAGGPPVGGALDITDEQLQDALNANMLTSVRLIRAALPHMAAGGWGRINCITSYSIVFPQPHLALSNVARTTLAAWARAASGELPTGVTLNLSCPGPHATARGRAVATGDMGDPAEFGKIVAFLCSDPARWINGQLVVVDGGISAEAMALSPL